MKRLIFKIAAQVRGEDGLTDFERDGGLIGAANRHKFITAGVGLAGLGAGAIAANSALDHIGHATGADFLADHSKKIVAGTGMVGLGMGANKLRKIVKEDEDSRDYGNEKNWRWR